jgi:hypothetical protein
LDTVNLPTLACPQFTNIHNFTNFFTDNIDLSLPLIIKNSTYLTTDMSQALSNMSTEALAPFLDELATSATTPISGYSNTSLDIHTQVDNLNSLDI